MPTPDASAALEIPGEGGPPPATRWTVDECWDNYPNHPTIFVQDCSPDRVLSRDGQTSRACRRCGCGTATAHVGGCARGLGPKPRVETWVHVQNGDGLPQSTRLDGLVGLIALMTRSDEWTGTIRVERRTIPVEIGANS